MGQFFTLSRCFRKPAGRVFGQFLAIFSQEKILLAIFFQESFWGTFLGQFLAFFWFLLQGSRNSLAAGVAVSEWFMETTWQAGSLTSSMCA